MRATGEGRLPDFIILGAMKAGTTSLFRWLGEQPEVHRPSVKEPHFFSEDGVWRKGVAWYGRLFVDAAPNELTGEASASYTRPAGGVAAADRMRRVIPDARLIYVVREPIERLRSHYRHEVQRGRERRWMAEALEGPESDYIGTSRYFSRLQPFIEAFPREQLCVVRLEDLLDQSSGAWAEVLDHLGLPHRPRPSGTYNVTSEKRQFTGLLLKLWDRKLLPRTARLPSPIRRLGKRLLFRDTAEYRARLGSSRGPVPRRIRIELAREVARLESWLGRSLYELEGARG